MCARTWYWIVAIVFVHVSRQVESADLETENNNKPVVVEEEDESVEEEGEPVLVTTLSPATSSASLYASEKFYSDAESDDEYKDPLPDFYPQSKSLHSVSFTLSICLIFFVIFSSVGITFFASGNRP